MSDFKCALVHTPQLCLNPQDKSLVSNINFCAMGIYSLANEIEKEGFETEIIHLGIEKYLNKDFFLSDYTAKKNIKFAAFSLHWHPQAYDVIETIRVLKEKNPNIFIMLGGFTASYFAYEIMENFPFIDTVLTGEGELPIRKLVRKVYENNSDLSEIPNLLWRKNGNIISNKCRFVATDKDLDSYEFFDIEKMKNYRSYAKIPFFMEYTKENQLNNPMSSQGITLGRGCTGNCTWCGGGFDAIKKVTGRDFISYRSTDKVIEEIKKLKEKWGIEVYRFAFDPHPSDRKYLIELLNKIAEEFHGNLTTNFTLNGLPDKEILNVYKKAFPKDSVIAISPEFYNEKLRKFHKSFYYSNNELENILNYMDEIGVKSELYFSTLPTTTEKDNKDSETYGNYLKDRYKFVEKFYLIPIQYEPAAPWTMTPEKFGLDIVPEKFINYYNNTKCVPNSFENRIIFHKAISGTS